MWFKMYILLHLVIASAIVAQLCC